jgi:HEAT repeat protein
MKKFAGVMTLLLFVSVAARCEDIAALVKQLKDPDPEKRRAAAKVLSEAGQDAKPAVAALAQALRDKDLFVRRFAAQALGELGSDAKSAAPALAVAVKDEKKEVGEAACVALGKMGADGVAGLTDAVKDKARDPVVRRKAAEALGQLGSDAKPAVKALTEALKDNDVRVEAANALGQIGPDAKSAIPALTAATDKKQRDRTFKKAATDALKKIQQTEK